MAEAKKKPETRTYLTTEKAGPRVAGRIVPTDKDGKAKAGVEIELTAIEAEYELALGTIALKGAPVAKAPAKTAERPAS